MILESSRREKVLTVTMNSPVNRNALGPDLVAGLKMSLASAAEDDGVRAIVLTGAGTAFSAGADLSALEDLQNASLMENQADSASLAELFRAIYLHPKPIIAKVNGHAIAGGCGLASVCDLSIAASGVKMGFTEVRIGFVPAIVMVFVLRKLGEGAARNLLLRGNLITSDEAVGIGLISECVSADQLDARIDHITREMVANTSASALALTKGMIGRVPGMGFDEAIAYAIQMNAFARGTDDCKAGISAFLRKTDPPWKQ